MKRFQLKNFQSNESMSEETLCFSADLYENGKLIAHICNRGHGGGNEVRPIEGLTYKDVIHIENIDTECEILTIAEEMHLVRQHQTKALVMEKDGKTYTKGFKLSIAQIKKKPQLKLLLENEIRKAEKDGYRILNTNL